MTETNTNILASITMELSADGINYRKASDFQGVLFTKIDSEYADFLHKEQMHPYSQYIYQDEHRWYWKVSTLNNEAYKRIIEPLLAPEFNRFHINNGDINVDIKNKSIVTKSYSDLMEDFYEKPAENNFDLQILTLTAFKQRGRYNVTPDLRLIFQNLMMKYSIILGNENMEDEDTLNQIIDDTIVSKYRLKTGIFPIEGRNIPGFNGNLSLRLFGSETMMRYVRLLLKFGEFSGVGIKTGMGMGAIKIIEEESSD